MPDYSSIPGLRRAKWVLGPVVASTRGLRASVPARDLLPLAWRIARVQRHVPCPHSLEEIATIARALALRKSLPGEVVECGAFKGGSTARLSLLCQAFDRSLVVFDSFEGLPVPEPWDAAHHIGRPRVFTEGEYSGTLDEVRRNVERYGRLDRCVFVRGWFDETMPHSTPTEIAVALIDADLVRSTRDAITEIWPRLQRGGVVFVHDARDAKLDTFLAGWAEEANPSAQSERGAALAWFEK